MNKRIKKKQIKMRNKKLCERYPFLIPRNRWTDKTIWDKRIRKRNWQYVEPYSYTELDDMPEGWRKAFGIQMCEEIKEVLIKGDYLYDYRIAQIKEKFAELRWYDEGTPDSIYREIQDIIYKYEEISAQTCIICGKPATKISTGWICPYCDKCANKLSERIKFKEIDNDNN